MLYGIPDLGTLIITFLQKFLSPAIFLFLTNLPLIYVLPAALANHTDSLHLRPLQSIITLLNLLCVISGVLHPYFPQGVTPTSSPVLMLILDLFGYFPLD